MRQLQILRKAHYENIGYEYLIRDYQTAKTYYEKVLELDCQTEYVSERELSTDYSRLGCLMIDMGRYKEAYQNIKKAIELESSREEDAETIMSYCYVASVCSELSFTDKIGLVCYTLDINSDYTEEKWMSLQKIQLAFETMNHCEAWSIQLLRIKTSKNKGTKYAAFSVNLTPQVKLTDIVKEISDHFVDGEKGELKSFVRVQDYDGTAEGNVIYKLNVQNPLIKEEYDILINALANTEQEADPLSQKLQAYVIQGDIEIGDEQKRIKMISMQNPITTLKHKFLHENNTFKEIESKVLSLRLAIDVLILNDEIYLSLIHI